RSAAAPRFPTSAWRRTPPPSSPWRRPSRTDAGGGPSDRPTLRRGRPGPSFLRHLEGAPAGAILDLAARDSSMRRIWMSTAAMPYEHLGEALATDYFLIREQFTDEQWDMFIRTRRFVDREVLPVINDYWERADFPWPLARRLAELGIVGDDIQGYGCPGMSPMAAGLVHMELHRGDGSLATFLGVQSGLAMKTIHLLGSEAEKARWLPPRARLEKIGAFALTEPSHGSDSIALETSARPDGKGGWILNGAKRWIGNGTIADVVIVWARSVEDGKVKGFLV